MMVLFNVEIYSLFEDHESLGQTGAVILQLMQPFLDKGYHLFMDNWYNSVSLTEYKSQIKTYITGTLQTDRKVNPKGSHGKEVKEGIDGVPIT